MKDLVAIVCHKNDFEMFALQNIVGHPVTCTIINKCYSGEPVNIYIQPLINIIQENN